MGRRERLIFFGDSRGGLGNGDSIQSPRKGDAGSNSSVQHPGGVTDARKVGRRIRLEGPEAKPRHLGASTRERDGWQSEAPPSAQPRSRGGESEARGALQAQRDSESHGGSSRNKNDGPGSVLDEQLKELQLDWRFCTTAHAKRFIGDRPTLRHHSACEEMPTRLPRSWVRECDYWITPQPPPPTLAILSGFDREAI